MDFRGPPGTDQAPGEGGDYRMIYRIDGQRRLVTVTAIEHRSGICRPRRA